MLHLILGRSGSGKTQYIRSCFAIWQSREHAI